MDATLIFAIIFAVLAVGAWITGKALSGSPPRQDTYSTESSYLRARAAWNERSGAGRIGKRVAIGLSVVVGLFFVLSCVTKVGTNQVGIMNSFGRPVDALPNGVHLKPPWQTKVEFDGARQFLRFEAKGNGKEAHGEKTFPCFEVRIANNAGACVEGVVTWQMHSRTAAEKEQAVELYRQYRTFERLNDNFVAQSTRAALLATFADVNPLVPDKNPSFAELSSSTLRAVRQAISSQVDVEQVQITFINWDDKTDAAIQAVQAQIAKTAEETQRQKTNEAAARAAAALGSQQSGPPPSDAVLINKCLDIAQAQGKEPGYCFLRGGTPIIAK